MPIRRLLLLGLLALPAAASAQASLIVLVRHGEKATTGGADPSLSVAGQARAEALAAVVASSGIQHILVTEYRRTVETAAVAARQAGLTPTLVRVGKGPVPEHARAVVRTLDSLSANSAALVVGHSNTIAPIIAALGGPALPDLGDDEYSTLFVIERTNGTVRLLRSAYGEPGIRTAAP